MRTRTATVLVTAAAVSLAGVLPATAAPTAGGEFCGTFERAPDTTGAFQINNNLWGDSPKQCIAPLSGGFEITQSQANLEFGGAPASYPSIIDGEHYGEGNDSKTFPVKISDVPDDLRTSATLDTGADGAYNAAWDIWVNTTPDSPDENDDLEAMIWPNQKGGPTPIGTKTETITIENRAYAVWVGKGPGGTDVVSYVDVETTDTPDVPLKPFLDDATERGAVSASSYVTSVQLGFEPWKGGKGLRVEDFRVGTADGESPSPEAVPKPAPKPIPGPQKPKDEPALSLAGAGITTAGYDGARAVLTRPGADGDARYDAEQQRVRLGDGRCLDVAYAGRGAGDAVQAWPCTDGADQQVWTLDDGVLTNPVSRLCLDPAHGSTDAGAMLQLWECDAGKDHQRAEVG